MQLTGHQQTLIRAITTGLNGRPDQAVDAALRVGAGKLKDHRTVSSLDELPAVDRTNLFNLGSSVTNSSDESRIVLAGAFVNLVLIDPKTDRQSLEQIGEQINYVEGNQSGYLAVLQSAGLI